MSLSRVIEVSFNGGSIAYVKADTVYFYNNGILFKPTDIDLPASYQVHWADSPQASSTLETIGTAEGAPIPDDLWSRSRVIYGWIYLHPTNDSSITAYEVRIYKNVRAGLPDGTEPTPAEQSTIDQLISALNSAVEQTGEDVESASQSAQSAESAKTAAESARDTAGEYANDAESSAASASTSASQASNSASASAESAEQAAQIKADVENLVDDAQSYAESALIASQASVTARNTAQGYAQSASASAQSASTSASNASTSAQTASTKATEASTSAQTASQKATESAQSATNASQSAQTAEQAKTASQTAQGLAESARDSAVSAKTDAESAKADAESARDEAQSAVASISGALADKAPVITDTASGAIASFTDGADDLPLKSLIVDINPIQDLSNGDPSPENICPISGWTSVDVEQSGVNVWDEEWGLGIYSLSNGLPVPNASSIRGKNRIVAKPSTDYYCNNNNMRVLYYDESDNYLGFVSGLGIKTTPTNCAYIRMYLGNDYGTTYNHDVCINYPSTDHDYHPYTGRSITIQLGQTVYGGKLDVLSGVLTVTHKYATYDGSENWGIVATQRYAVLWGQDASADNLDDTQIANWLVAGMQWYFMFGKFRVQNNGAICIGNTIDLDNNVFKWADVTEFKAYLAQNPFQVCYRLATPITIQLTPNQVNSLYGQNNLWADSGDTEVEYRADTKLFIERLTAPDSADMIADANITSGQYFMVGNSLYKATANIANGSAIVVGTNCIRKSLSEALNEINA